MPPQSLAPAAAVIASIKAAVNEVYDTAALRIDTAHPAWNTSNRSDELTT